jgi:hypothetical protein
MNFKTFLTINEFPGIESAVVSEQQLFDFNTHRHLITRWIEQTLAGERTSKEYNPFYHLIVGRPTVGDAEKIGLDSSFAAEWKSHLNQAPWIGERGEPWRQINLGDEYPKATGEDRTLNFYVTVSKETQNVKNFLKNIFGLSKYLEPISQRHQTPIKFKTHSLLDSFVGHNDSLKIYYYDPKIKNEVVTAVKKWISDNKIDTNLRTHEHGVDIKSGGGSFGQILSNHIYDTLVKLIKTHGTAYSVDKYYQWLQQHLPTLISQVKPA